MLYDILVNSTTGGEVIAVETTMNTEDDTRCDSRTMPDTWFFPGFLVFATLGSIVADEESMISYQSELLMTSSPSLPPDEKMIAGQKFERKTALANRHLGKQEKDEFVAIAVRGGSCCTLDGVIKVKTKPGSASSTLTGTPSNGNEVTRHHRLVAAGIAQSKLIADCQHQSRLKDRKVVYWQNIIAGKERLIEEKRFQIGGSNPENPNHEFFLNDFLQVVIAELSEVYDELHRLKFLLIEEQELQDSTLLQMKAKAEGQGGMSSNAA